MNFFLIFQIVTNLSTQRVGFDDQFLDNENLETNSILRVDLEQLESGIVWWINSN